MNKHYTITGKYTGKEYLVTLSFEQITLYKQWSFSELGGLGYCPSEGIKLSENPKKAHRKALRIVRGWEKVARWEEKRRDKQESEFQEIAAKQGGPR